MSAPYTLTRLTDVEDSAARFGYDELQESRFAKNDLESEQTGISYQRLKPGKRQRFAHKHERAEVGPRHDRDGELLHDWWTE